MVGVPVLRDQRGKGRGVSEGGKGGGEGKRV